MSATKGHQSHKSSKAALSRRTQLSKHKQLDSFTPGRSSSSSTNSSNSSKELFINSPHHLRTVHSIIYVLHNKK